MSKTWLTEIDESISQFGQMVSANVARWARARTPKAFAAAEQEAHRAASIGVRIGGSIQAESPSAA
jgi:hypothetical protein